VTSHLQPKRPRTWAARSKRRSGCAASGALATLALATSAPAQFGPPTAVPWSPCTPPLDVDSGDLDGDGDLDVVASGCGGLYWFENLDGLGSLGQAQPVAACQATPYVAVSDLDLDGDPDLVSFSAFDGVRWYDNQSGSFGPGLWIGPATVGVTDVAAGDLDSDGDPDLLCTWEGLDAVAWFENDGQGGFGPEQPVTAPALYSRPWGVDAGDLDGDGDLDVLLALRGDDRAVWFENLAGLGSFGPPRTIDLLVNDPRSITSGDLDGDGDLDVLVANGWGQWHENLDALGSFGEARAVGEASDLLVADLDCDGDADVLASQGSGWLQSPYSIAWHENLDGAGAFASHYLEQGTAQWGAPPLDAHPADLDGDGDREVLATVFSIGQLGVYENLSCGTSGRSRRGASIWSAGPTSKP